jgi:uncharacterized protein
MQIAWPYHIDTSNRTAQADDERHVRDLIEQVLFTSPTERVMRPSFGSGALQLVFAPNSAELAATTQFLVEGALQQWLGDVIDTQEVVVEAIDAKLTITVRYVIRRTQESRLDTFTRAVTS